MKLFLFTVFVAITFIGQANGVPGSSKSCVHGIVVEAGTAETLPGVRVSVNGTDIFTYTDKEGNFELSNLPSGAVELSFSLVSFNAHKVPLVTSPGVKTPMEIALIAR